LIPTAVVVVGVAFLGAGMGVGPEPDASDSEGVEEASAVDGATLVED